MDPVLSSYEEIPYESTPIHDAHPDVIATSALLLGLDPPAVPTARILELGCSTGGNLITIALAFPSAEFVGIDLSPRQIAQGQAIIAKLGLKNVALHAKSILDISADFGHFDYIICHGVYSWVPEEVRRKILSIFAHNLSPNGIAYVSYNTYPGWHIRGMIRQMLNYHVRDISDPRQRIADARAFMDLMAKTIRDPEAPYGKLMVREAEMLRQAPDSYLYHEHLEQDNRPLYFHEFASQCTDAGLDYLAEARLLNHAPVLMSAMVREALSQLPADPVEREQYIDFLQNRTFRRSLVSHRGMAQRVRPSPQRIAMLHVEGNVSPTNPKAEGRAGAAEEFSTREGQKISTNNPWMIALLHVLFEVWPRSMKFVDLAAAVKQRLADWADPQVREAAAQMDDSAGSNPLTATLMQLYLGKMVELHLNPPRFSFEAPQRPVAFALARLQAADGLERVSTLRHRSVYITELTQLLLPLLDGTRGREELVDEVMIAVQRGTFAIEKQGQRVANPQEARQVIAESISPALTRMAQSALLVE